MGHSGVVLRSQNQSLTDFRSTPRNPSSIIDSDSTSSIVTGGSISSGYRQLAKNNTLAGRTAVRYFLGEELVPKKSNRLRMVSKLRKKERFMIWRSVLVDLCRYFMTNIVRFSPAFVNYRVDIVTSAVRHHGHRRRR